MSNVKYITASTTERAWWDDLYQLDRRPTGFNRVQVVESGSDPQPTGLLDAQSHSTVSLSRGHHGRRAERRSLLARKILDHGPKRLAADRRRAGEGVIDRHDHQETHEHEDR